MTDYDKEIQELLDEVEKRKANIERIKRPDYRTNLKCSWQEFYNNDTQQTSLNLNVVTDVNTLVKIYAHIKTQKESFEASCKTLKIKAKFTYLGFSFEDWGHDIKCRIAKVTVNSKIQELKVLEERLEKLVSPEMRRRLELDAIRKELM